MLVDGLPTGSLFSFSWNMLVSVSFQFIGFLLTFLLHTTHSAKLGSRAGLGVTLIQYGFALRNKAELYNAEVASESWGGWKGLQSGDPLPTFNTAAEADDYFKNHNISSSVPEDMVDLAPTADATTEWLSFLLMTIGALKSIVYHFHCLIMSLGFRMVHFVNLDAVFLACETMGAQYSQFVSERFQPS
jgi:Protein of unknown function (DUF2370)